MATKIIDIEFYNYQRRIDEAGRISSLVAVALLKVPGNSFKEACSIVEAHAKSMAFIYGKEKSPAPRQRKQGKPLKSTIEIKG